MYLVLLEKIKTSILNGLGYIVHSKKKMGVKLPVYKIETLLIKHNKLRALTF
ncbi:hypothetical protein HMPREF3224_00474 [Anaerococcus hydrogenalis]|nr:hypothetical protein HMPREF3224_00474 [Anaerococcus hydrogenalis]